MQKRAAIIRDARNGGSVTPELMAFVKKELARDEPQLSVLTRAEIKSVEWNEQDRRWDCSLERYGSINAASYDYVFFVTCGYVHLST